MCDNGVSLSLFGSVKHMHLTGTNTLCSIQSCAQPVTLLWHGLPTGPCRGGMRKCTSASKMMKDATGF